MKKSIAIVVSALFALVVAITAIVCLERVEVGNVAVIYSMNGVEDEVLTQGWHFIAPLKRVKQFPISQQQSRQPFIAHVFQQVQKQFPISQQQIVFSNNPGDYPSADGGFFDKDGDTPDWHIDAPADGGMVSINLTVNYNFLPDRVVELYKKFNGMDGEAIVASRVQNSIVAYVKEVTPRFSVMDIYSDKKSEVNDAITEYLNKHLTEEYGINVSSALVIDVQLDNALQEKIKAKEQAKQDVEIAELDRQTALARAETEKVEAETKAAVDIIQAEADAQRTLIEAEAEAKANQIVAASITSNLIAMKEAEARMEHGWVTVQGAGTVVTTKG